MTDKFTTIEIEERVAQYFDPRRCLIVPNISWGMDIHECDLLIVRKSGHGIEVEIKITRADLKKDAEKWHKHQDSRIREFYFAIPDYLENCIEFIPEHAGVILLSRSYDYGDHIYCKTVRPAKINRNSIKFSEQEMFNIARLGTMRIWSLKRKLINRSRKRKKKQIGFSKNQLRLAI